MRPHPASLSEAVLWSQAQSDVPLPVLLDEFLDAFHEADDAYVGAVGEHLARRWSLNIPPWTAAGWREVAEPWFVGEMGVGLSGLLLVERPIAFRRRPIFTEAEPLRRARMPRDGAT